MMKATYKIESLTQNCFRAVILVVVGLSLNVNSAFAGDDAPRERLLLDFGWKFYLGDSLGATLGGDWLAAENLKKAGISTGPADPVICDAGFRVVNLPHDWAVELPFDPK